MKKVEGYLIKKGEVLSNGDKIDENCQFNINKVYPNVFRDFNHSIPPIGEVESIIYDENGIRCTCKLDIDHLTIHLTKKEKFINWLRRLIFLKPKYKERNILDYLIAANQLGFAIGGQIKEKEGDIIKNIDIREVSITNNLTNKNTGFSIEK